MVILTIKQLKEKIKADNGNPFLMADICRFDDDGEPVIYEPKIIYSNGCALNIENIPTQETWDWSLSDYSYNYDKVAILTSDEINAIIKGLSELIPYSYKDF